MVYISIYYISIMESIQKTLMAAGLEPIAVEIYLILIQKGELTPKDIMTYTNLSRASIYEAITGLQKRQLITYRKKGRNAFYAAAHPEAMGELVLEKEREQKLLEADMKEVVKMLAGTYSVANDKPGIRFYEGTSQIRELYMDSLNATGEILGFNGGSEDYFNEHMVDTIQPRMVKGVYKKIITEDTPTARKHELEYIQIPRNEELTEVRFISTNTYPFDSSVMIYDDVVVFFTLNEKVQLGFMIKSQEVANIHKTLFYHLWKQLPVWDKKS